MPTLRTLLCLAAAARTAAPFLRRAPAPLSRQAGWSPRLRTWLRPLVLLGALGALLAGEAAAQTPASLLATNPTDEYIIEHTLTLPKGEIFAAMYTPDQKYVVTLGSNHAIRLWDAETGRVFKDFRTGEHEAIVAVIHPQTNVIFTGGKDGALRAWDVAKGTSSLTLEGHTSPISVLVSNAEGKRLFSGAANGKVMVWDVDAAKSIATLSAHQGPVTALALHPDGKHLVTGGRDRNIKVWDWKTGKVVNAFTGHLGTINALRFPADPEQLISAAADGTIKIWAWREKEKPEQRTLFDHKRAVTGVALHPNGKWLLSGSQDESIKIWNLATGKVLQELTLVDGPLVSIALSSDGRRLVAAYTRDRVRTWKLDKSAFLASLVGHEQSLVDLDFTNDSKFLISAAIDKTLKIWNLQSRKVLRSYNTGNHIVQTVRFSPSNAEFATGGADGQVWLWTTATGKVARRLQGHNGKVNVLAYHPVDSALISGGSDKQWILWDPASGRPLQRATAGNDQVTAVAMNARQPVFATGSDDGTIRIWTYPAGKAAQTLTGHTNGVTDLRFDPSGKTLASASKDGTVKVWDFASGKVVYDFTGHEFIVSRIRFSPDGRALISVSRDKTVKLWDVQTGKFLRTVSGERNQITALAVSRDGRVLATGSIGRDINLMAYPLKVLLAERESGARKPEQAESEADPEASAGDAPARLVVNEDALAKAQEAEVENLAYKVITGSDSAGELRKLERQLNDLLAAGNFCASAAAMDTLAHQILVLAPYDMAAYHALVITGIIQQDLKMIYLMSKVGLQAVYLGSVYDYDLPTAAEAKLAYWQERVFDPSRRRAGRELVLEIVDCDGKSHVQSMPSELLTLDIPREVLKILASRKARVNFRQFKGLDAQTYLNRVYYLIDSTIEANQRNRTKDEPFKLVLDKAPQAKVGLLELDMAEVDTFGPPGRVPFQLRRERGTWLTYTTDSDRRKQLLLPVGNYYLQVHKKVRKVFTITAEQALPLMVGQQ